MDFLHARAAHLKLGCKGERAARKLLELCGAEFLASNWRCKAGELDLVMRDGCDLLFVEVKSLRRIRGFTPLNNLSGRQRRRNFNAAKVFLRAIGLPDLTARFLLVEVVFSRRGALLELRRHWDYLPSLVPGSLR